MRFITLHRTEPRWEAGLPPSPEEIARVGAMMGELGASGALIEGEGLRASSTGVRMSFHDGKRRLTRGPFTAEPGAGVESGFLLLRAPSLDEAIEWTTRLGQILGDARIELRPVTEPWDIGMAPPPAEPTPLRFMALFKEPEPRRTLSAERQQGRTKVLEEMKRAGAYIAEVQLGPTSTGVRLARGAEGPAVIDGPFAESKELVAGYAIVELPSKEAAVAFSRRFFDAVATPELDIRELVTGG